MRLSAVRESTRQKRFELAKAAERTAKALWSPVPAAGRPPAANRTVTHAANFDAHATFVRNPHTPSRLDTAQRVMRARLAQQLAGHADLRLPFSSSAQQRVLFITTTDKICRSQTFPFHFYRQELRSRFGVELREVTLQRFEEHPTTAPRDADVVCVQTWFNRSAESLRKLCTQIKQQNPRARIVYLDWFAPTDLRLAEALHDHIDLYVKKHVFRDRSAYGQPTFGDTNLMTWYGHHFALDHETVLYPIPDGFLDRLLVGPSFLTADYLLPTFLHGRPDGHEQPLDVHARIAFKGSPWYSAMRRAAVDAMETLTDLRVVSSGKVSRRRYLQELSSAKMCFSPFGYGEVCWRDYEAMMAGSLLLKPDMGHVETKPDLFIPNETYVPLRWDFSDLEEKVRYYLAYPGERARIVHTAFQRLHDYLADQEFVSQMAPLFATPVSKHGTEVK